MIKAVIFDMDGVLVDSEPMYMKLFSDFLKHYNVEVTDEDLNALPGCSLNRESELMHEWWVRSGDESKTVNNIKELFNKFADSYEFTFKDKKNPGVDDVLKELKRTGRNVAIASSSPKDNIMQVIDEIGISDYIDVIVSGDMFAESKPNPAIYITTLKSLNIKADECVAVEDSTYGIQAAVAAGIKTIAKRDNRFGFDQSIADYIVDNFNEIIEIINKNE